MEVGARLCVLLAALAAPGCFWVTTKHEGDVLRADVKDLKGRVAQQDKAVEGKVKQLDESLEKATKVLSRNSADLGAELDKLSGEVATLTGQAEGYRREIETLRAELARVTAEYQTRLDTALARLEALEAAKANPQAVMDKDTLFASGQKKLDAGQSAEARKDLRAFVQRFARDEKADDAQYLVGMSFLKDKDYEKAIGEFQRLIDGYATGDLVDDALFQAGQAASEMKWCTDARAYLGVLVQKYPKSPFAKDAQKKLDALKKKAKDKAVCQS